MMNTLWLLLPKRLSGLGIAVTFLLACLVATDSAAQVPGTPLLWLRSDSKVLVKGDSIAAWSDMFDTTKKFFVPAGVPSPTKTAAAFGTFPGITLDGVAQYMEGPSIYPINQDYSLTIVCKINDFTKTNNVFSGIVGHAIWFSGTTTPNVFHGDFNNVCRSTVAYSSAPTILTIKYNDATQIVSLTVNGIDADSNFIGPCTDASMLIGAFARGNLFAGSVAEIILYDKYINPTEQQQIEHYLETRYGIAGPKPFVPSNVRFTSAPKSRELLPRGANDSAEVRIEGVVTQALKSDSIYVDCYRNSFWYQRLQSALRIVGDDTVAHFSFSQIIKAEPVEHRYVIGLKRNDGWDSVVANIDSVVSGDVIFICGQSNSIFGSSVEPFRSEFCRTFGNNMGQRGDTSWVLSDVAGGGNGPFVCEWGLTIQKLLLQNYNLPTVIINGGVGGTPIESHLRNNADPTNISTIYGNMLYRARKSGLWDKAKMMFWYQGESNLPDNYYNNWKTLYTSWRGDYPSIKKYYVVQTHTGCSQANASELREILRTLRDSLPDISEYCPAGAPGHDGCHYGLEGYQKIGNDLYRYVTRDFYGSSDTVGIESPNIQTAFYNDASHTTIGLLFGPQHSDMVVPADIQVGRFTESIRSYFYLDNDTNLVTSITAVGDTVFLGLKSATNDSSITYLPDVNYNDTAIVYEGPWLMNARGVGAFSFWHVPIVEKAVLSVPSVKSLSDDFIASMHGNTVQLELLKPTTVSMTVVDELGRTVWQSRGMQTTVGVHEYAMPELSGVYFLHIESEHQTKTIKLIR